VDTGLSQKICSNHELERNRRPTVHPARLSAQHAAVAESIAAQRFGTATRPTPASAPAPEICGINVIPTRQAILMSLAVTLTTPKVAQLISRTAVAACHRHCRQARELLLRVMEIGVNRVPPLCRSNSLTQCQDSHTDLTGLRKRHVMAPGRAAPHGGCARLGTPQFCFDRGDRCRRGQDRRAPREQNEEKSPNSPEKFRLLPSDIRATSLKSWRERRGSNPRPPA
jgi:hypothetical protein